METCIAVNITFGFLGCGSRSSAQAAWAGMISWIPSEMRWLFRELRPFVGWHIISFLCVSLGSFLALLSPLILKWLIDVVLPARRTSLLISAVALTFLCYQGRAALTAVGGYLTVQAAQRLALELRLNLIRHLDKLSADYHENIPVGASIYPLRDPVEEISYFGSDLVPSVLRTLMATMLTMGTMLVLNVRLTLAILPLIPVFLLARRHFRDRLECDSERVQQEQASWSNFQQEHFSSIIAIQQLCKERRQEREAFRFLARRVRSLSSLFRTGVFFTFYTSLTIGLGMSAVVGYGSWSVLRGTLTVGGLVAFFSYLTQLFEPLSGVAETYVRTQKVLASIRQVQAVMALQPTVANQHGAVKFPDTNPWTIDLRDVRFQYPGSRGLLLIQRLRIAAGEMVAIVGENGAGKSTLAKLVARFYDVNCGSVSIAGYDIRNIRIESLREQVCYLPPHPILFDTTLAGNLRLGRPTASNVELTEVLEGVGLAAWLTGLPEGLEHRFGPGGSQLSGGQRQRLGIARAILLLPRVLILDEATSSLDGSSEQQLLRNLRRLLPRSTVILISHRLSAMSVVERVIVLQAGCVVEDDDPVALFGKQTAYSLVFSAGSSVHLRGRGLETRGHPSATKITTSQGPLDERSLEA